MVRSVTAGTRAGRGQTQGEARIVHDARTAGLRRRCADRAAILGARTDLLAPRGPEPWRSALLLPRRADHREQSHGRPSRVGPYLQGCGPALQGLVRLRAAVPERFRLPGALGRGRSREGAGLQLEARDRVVRPRPLRSGLPRARRELRVHPDGAVSEARSMDGLAQFLLHDVRYEYRVQLGLPAAMPRAGLAVPGASPNAVVRALRHLDLAAR